MKVPKLGSVESVLLIGVASLAGYALYKAYQTGSNIKTKVTGAISDIGDSIKTIYDDGILKANKVRTATMNAAGIAPTYPESDQSAAETARLIRQNDDGSVVGGMPELDIMGNPTGGFLEGDSRNISNPVAPSDTSPEAVGVA